MGDKDTKIGILGLVAGIYGVFLGLWWSYFISHVVNAADIPSDAFQLSPLALKSLFLASTSIWLFMFVIVIVLSIWRCSGIEVERFRSCVRQIWQQAKTAVVLLVLLSGYFVSIYLILPGQVRPVSAIYLVTGLALHTAWVVTNVVMMLVVGAEEEGTVVPA